jgi:hypothetical protein
VTEELRIDRRQFAGKLAVGSSAAALMFSSTSCSAADDEKPASADKEKKADDSEERQAPPPVEMLLLSILLQQYPTDHFDETALKGIYNDIRGDVARGKVLGSFPLKNSDEPAIVFQAYRRTN